MKKIREWVNDLNLSQENIPTIIVGFCVFVAMIIIIIGIRHSLNHGEEMSRIVVDTQYIPSYQGIETTYEYTYDIFSEEGFKKVPNTHSKIYPDEYRLLYMVTYEDGTVTNEWVTVTKDEYLKFAKTP